MAAESDLDQDIRELCREKPCVQKYTDAQTGQIIDCPRRFQLTAAAFRQSCYVAEGDDAAFFAALKGYDPQGEEISKILIGFEKVLKNEGEHFRALLHAPFQSLQPLDPNTPINIHEEFVTNPSFQYCGNRLCAYYMQSKHPVGKDLIHHGIFHISLHKSYSRYIKGTKGKAFACAAWPRHDNSQGAFHYKIDRRTSTQRFPEKYLPYREFVLNSNGTIGESANGFRHNLRLLTNDPEINSYLTDDLVLLHEYIYLQFIHYWNRCINLLSKKEKLPTASSSMTQARLSQIKANMVQSVKMLGPLLPAIQSNDNILAYSPSLKQSFESIHSAYEENKRKKDSLKGTAKIVPRSFAPASAAAAAASSPRSTVRRSSSRGSPTRERRNTSRSPRRPGSPRSSSRRSSSRRPGSPRSSSRKVSARRPDFRDSSPRRMASSPRYTLRKHSPKASAASSNFEYTVKQKKGNQQKGKPKK
uniref:Uncharacterized protein n=1 Tax=viral metagenome TaxID=1070528 RepID=A0A6C0KTE2_9ZZZZ